MMIDRLIELLLANDLVNGGLLGSFEFSCLHIKLLYCQFDYSNLN